MGILIQSSPALSDGLLFDEKVSKQILSDLDYQNKTIDSQDKQIENLNKLTIDLYRLSDEFKLKIEGLEKDKTLLKDRGDSFEKSYKDTSKKLDECKEDKPSRFTWFALGFLTAVITGTVAAFSLSR